MGMRLPLLFLSTRGRVGKKERGSVRVPYVLFLRIFQLLLLLPVMGLCSRLTIRCVLFKFTGRGSGASSVYFG